MKAVLAGLLLVLGVTFGAWIAGEAPAEPAEQVKIMEDDPAWSCTRDDDRLCKNGEPVTMEAGWIVSSHGRIVAPDKDGCFWLTYIESQGRADLGEVNDGERFCPR